jgi:MoxR-like ATPase
MALSFSGLVSLNRAIFKRFDHGNPSAAVAFWSEWLAMSDRGPLSPYPESPSGEITVEDPGATPLPFVDPERDLDAVREVAATRRVLLAEIGKRIVGQERVIDHLLVALFARGHCLFVGVPGLAKTLLIQTLADALALSFGRIQFTPDLMPADITGTDVLEEDRATGRRVFRFVRGPIFAHVVLADEVNRTPPKTQAALLQSMQEYRVSAGGQTYALPLPFLVFATQNPIEQEGTYPLPEAQLDRFMFQIDVGYPSADEEVRIVNQMTTAYRPQVRKVLSPERILELQDVVLRVPAAPHVVQHAVALCRATRPGEANAPEMVKKYVSWGAGPRASQYLVLAAKARAILQGRYAAAIEDVRALAGPVLVHRVLPNFHAEADGLTAHALVERLVDAIRP